MTDLIIHHQRKEQRIALLVRDNQDPRTRKTLTVISAEEAEEMALDLLAAATLLREQKNTRMPQETRDDLTAMLALDKP